MTVLYAWCIYQRQAWSELGRAYRFRRPSVDDAPQVIAAKNTLLDGESTVEQRQNAIGVLEVHGACTPNRPSILREVLTFLCALGVVMAGLILLVLLF
ncbi:MAG: hypothetical protein ACRDOF_01140 [Gaiellaceae bacterium]